MWEDRFPEHLEKEGENQPFPFLGRIEHDEQVTDYNLEGRSLLELPEESPAYRSVKAIMEKVGY